MCTSLYGVRLSANVHTTAKRAILNQSDDSILDLMCNFKSVGPSSAQRHDHETSFGQHAQAKLDIRSGSYKTFSKHVSTKHFNLLSD